MNVISHGNVQYKSEKNMPMYVNPQFIKIVPVKTFQADKMTQRKEMKAVVLPRKCHKLELPTSMSKEV